SHRSDVAEGRSAYIRHRKVSAGTKYLRIGAPCYRTACRAGGRQLGAGRTTSRLRTQSFPLLETSQRSDLQTPTRAGFAHRVVLHSSSPTVRHTRRFAPHTAVCIHVGTSQRNNALS